MQAAERLSREELSELQKNRLRRLLKIARERSPYYGRLLAEGPEDPNLEDLPILTKEKVRENFDDIVTDRRLKYQDIDNFVFDREHPTHLGKYRVLFTSGTTGERGATVYGPDDWITSLALLVRGRKIAGGGGRFLSRRRSVAIANPSAAAPARQSALTLRNPLNSLLLVSTNQAMTEISAQVQAHDPQVLNADGLILLHLATMQLQGKLKIAPQVLWSNGEALSPSMIETMEQAWGTTPYDVYGATETGMLGASCELRNGLHLYEDYFIFEIVDENYRPVAPGETGRRLLVTNLYNETLPQFRYEITDHLTLANEPCPCGRSLRLISAISGREAEVIHLAAREGGEVAILPFYLYRLPRAVPGIQQAQFIFEGGTLSVSITLTPGADSEAVPAGVRRYLEETLPNLGAVVPLIVIRIVDEIPKDPVSGKTLLVINRDAPPAMKARIR